MIIFAAACILVLLITVMVMVGLVYRSFISCILRHMISQKHCQVGYLIRHIAAHNGGSVCAFRSSFIMGGAESAVTAAAAAAAAIAITINSADGARSCSKCEVEVLE